MVKSTSFSLLVLALTVACAQPPTAPAPEPEPEPVSMPPAFTMQAGDIVAALEIAAAEQSNMAVGAITNSEEYRINLIRRTAAATAIVHERGTELHFIVEGAGTIVTGGTLVRLGGTGPAIIRDGLAVRVTEGDAMLIPAGTPHWYRAIEGAITYLEVRFNVELAE